MSVIHAGGKEEHVWACGPAAGRGVLMSMTRTTIKGHADEC